MDTKKWLRKIPKVDQLLAEETFCKLEAEYGYDLGFTRAYLQICFQSCLLQQFQKRLRFFSYFFCFAGKHI